jgi:SulP family sulfate permease
MVLYGILRMKFKQWPHIAILLAIFAAIGYGCMHMGYQVSCLKAVHLSDWKITLPKIDFDAINLLANTALALVFFGLLDSTSLSALMARFGERVNTNQVIFSLGMSNLACGLGSGMPVSGALMRSALSCDSAKTFFTGVFNGLFCLVGALLFGTMMGFVPQATLAVIILFLSFSLINRHAVKIVIKSTPSDAIVFAATFLAVLLFPLSTAIFFGCLLSVILFLEKASAPEMVEYSFDEEGELMQLPEDASRPHTEISIIHLEGNLFFAASGVLRDQIRQVCEREELKVIILKMRNAYLIDATCIMALEELAKYMQSKGRYLIVSEVRPSAMKIFENSGFSQILGKEHIFLDHPKNPTFSTAKALKHAQLLLGGQHASIRIFARQSKETKNLYNQIVEAAQKPVEPKKPLHTRVISKER